MNYRTHQRCCVSLRAATHPWAPERPRCVSTQSVEATRLKGTSTFSATSPAQSARTALKYAGVAEVSAAPNGWGRLDTDPFSCRPHPPLGGDVFLVTMRLATVVGQRSNFARPGVLADLFGTEPMGRPSLRAGESNFLRNGPSTTTPAVCIFFAYGYASSLFSLIPPRPQKVCSPTSNTWVRHRTLSSMTAYNTHEIRECSRCHRSAFLPLETLYWA
jgi:hypothetical protein